MRGLWYNNYVQWSIVAGGIALHVVLLFMHQGIFHELCVITEPYLFFNVYCLGEKINTRLKLLHAQFSFVRKVPVVVNDQTHTHRHIYTHILHVRTYTHSLIDRYGLSIRESLVVHTGNIWLCTDQEGSR